MGMQLIETIEVGAGGASSIEFTGIPQDGVDLVCLISVRADNYTSDFLYVQINGLTTGYNNIWLKGTGSAATSQTRNNVSGFEVFYQGASTTANTFGSGSIYFSNYTSGVAKSASFDHVWEQNATAADAFLVAGRHATTSPITSVKIDGGSTNFVQYSTASLYKITAD